jgi:hypothetical protein
MVRMDVNIAEMVDWAFAYPQFAGNPYGTFN